MPLTAHQGLLPVRGNSITLLSGERLPRLRLWPHVCIITLHIRHWRRKHGRSRRSLSLTVRETQALSLSLLDGEVLNGNGRVGA